jgi:hypothetical protein
LNKGFCVALTANQDNHFFTWGTITSATISQAGLRTATFSALKARRVYVTEDNNFQVRFRINNQQLGSISTASALQDLTLEVETMDPDKER